MKIDRKISTKTVVGNVKAILNDMIKNDEIERQLYSVVGIATRVINGESDNGPWVAFGGNFSAVNFSDGVEVRSSKCFLPDPATDMILSGLAPEDVSSVQFAFSIGIEVDETSITGYVYTVEPLLAPAENDPLEMLLAQINRPALENKSEEKSEKQEKPAATAKKKPAAK